ncbi:MAG: alpha/beta fold hydrolase [Acidimicrobiia bacterium]
MRTGTQDLGFVLVASPFTGPFAWSKVAFELRTRGRRVAVFDVDIDIDPPVVLVAHSGAGPQLPALAIRSAGVVGMVLVDALLPHPGRSWAQTVPDAFAATLKAEAVDGNLKPWPQWWGERRMAELIADPSLRDEFVRACPAVPVAVIDEVMADVVEPPGVFVQLSDAYTPETDAARTRGWPVLVLDAQHLALLTDPKVVADAVERAAALLTN